MPRNYDFPKIDPHWASSRETHEAVAAAIHAISDRTRAPEAIWESPTAAEWSHVEMAVEEYVREGLVEAEPDGRYPWGEETVLVQADHA